MIVHNCTQTQRSFTHDDDIITEDVLLLFRTRKSEKGYQRVVVNRDNVDSKYEKRGAGHDMNFCRTAAVPLFLGMAKKRRSDSSENWKNPSLMSLCRRKLWRLPRRFRHHLGSDKNYNF